MWKQDGLHGKLKISVMVWSYAGLDKIYCLVVQDKG